jgi:hypothetical protein
MFRTIRSLIPIVAAVACFSPIAAFAEVTRLPQLAPDVETVEQARDAFRSAGYTVSEAHSWDWMVPPVSSFQVQDATEDRVLMVLVYPSVSAAEAARLQAASHEQASKVESADSAGASPRLVTGYGPSVWNGNVALVEASGSQLRQLQQTQLDRDNNDSIETDSSQAPGQMGVVVDLDFQQALQRSTVNL